MEKITIISQKHGNVKAEITVVISLYNYRDYIVSALESVQSQTLDILDLIVVDDCSQDDSLNIVRAWLEQHGQRFNTYVLLHHLVNRGLGVTRNTAFTYAKTDYVFVLDADNMLYPRCLESLLAAIQHSNASFAYCYLEKFGDVSLLGNIEIWNPAKLRYGNTIDAMVLHRKALWQQVGGYAEDMPANGWEDFELWFKIARIQGWGVRVPEILARYRVHEHSMLFGETDLMHHKKQLWDYLRTKYPEFFKTNASNSNGNKSAELIVQVDRCEVYFDVLIVEGWAIPENSIKSVEVYVNDCCVGEVHYGIFRPDVGKAYPLIENSDLAGFRLRTSIAKVTPLTSKEYNIRFQVTEMNGQMHEILKSCTGNDYQAWIEQNEPDHKALEQQRRCQFAYEPTISLITPTFNTPIQYLIELFESVLRQTYVKWELCIADGASSDPAVQDTLKRYAAQDRRIKIQLLPENKGIAGNSNEALALVTGEFIGLLDHDDLLSPFALFEVIKTLNDHPEADFIYSDEDKITAEDRYRCEYFFKPDWSPDLLLSMMYTCHFTIYRRDLVEKLGGFRSRYDGSQDYDLALRVSTHTEHIYHIPKILYHWRKAATSVAGKEDAKNYTLVSQKQVLEDHLQRTGVSAEIVKGIANGRWRTQYTIHNTPKVTIMILAGPKLHLLQRNITSILHKSTYRNYQILVIDNSKDEDVQRYLARMHAASEEKVTFYKNDLKPFNFAALYNDALPKVDSPYMILLNDDTEVITPEWIEAMLEHAQREEIGVVGCKLLFPDHTIQHAGVTLGVLPPYHCGHAFKHARNDGSIYFDFPHVVRNVSAVTFACAMMRTSLYRELGGLDEVHFKVAFNDVDFCLRASAQGYRNLYTPYATLYHHESVTRKGLILPGEIEALTKKWGALIHQDPYYNPNLTKNTEDWTLNV